MVGFSGKHATEQIVLDGEVVSDMNANLTAGRDLTGARPIERNLGLCFMGVTKVGAFDVDWETAAELLAGSNPNGRPNSDVLRPLRNGSDLVRRSSHRWIIDFGSDTPLEKAALYERPFEFLVAHVKEERQKNGRRSYREKWWIHGEPRPAFRKAVEGKARYAATARVAKHRLFLWLGTVVLPDSKVIAVALDEDWSMGVLQARIHEVWTLANCGWHGLGNDATYNPTSCFETFPFPEPTEEQKAAIGATAAELDGLRNAWLNPPEWTRQEVLEFPGSANGPWARFVENPDLHGIGTVRYPRPVPKDDDHAKLLEKRTLTNLYKRTPHLARPGP
jgi:hypothetical protein